MEGKIYPDESPAVHERPRIHVTPNTRTHCRNDGVYPRKPVISRNFSLFLLPPPLPHPPSTSLPPFLLLPTACTEFLHRISERESWRRREGGEGAAIFKGTGRGRQCYPSESGKDVHPYAVKRDFQL